MNRCEWWLVARGPVVTALLADRRICADQGCVVPGHSVFDIAALLVDALFVEAGMKPPTWKDITRWKCKPRAPRGTR
jgi:hypothetical protein